jgi:hypothetical protein
MGCLIGIVMTVVSGIFGSCDRFVAAKFNVVEHIKINVYMFNTAQHTIRIITPIATDLCLP